MRKKCSLSTLITPVLLAVFASSVRAELTQPIHRVAREEAPAQRAQQSPTKLAARIAHAPQQPPFDLIPKPGEHPLVPGLELAKLHLREMDSKIQDYQAILYKRERIKGELGEQEIAVIKVRHNPFSVYMMFYQPHKGQECLYNAAPDGSKGVLVARGTGWKRRIGPIDLDPEGSIAMKNQKYPIMKLGIRNMVTELIEVATNDMQYNECEVSNSQRTINGRKVTLMTVVHPTPRSCFRFHKAEIFIDNELHIPIRYASYLWPEKPGAEPPLEEEYTYVNVKINNGFTNLDFDKENPAYFK